MPIKIIGVSGSPLPDSNTDRALQIALAATGHQTEFIKLSDLSLAPCNACLGCIATNSCVLQDDGIKLAEKVFKANGLIIAGWTPYSTIDSRTKTFMERLYPLRHRHGLMAGKAGAAIITSAIPPGREGLPAAAELGVGAIENYMLEEGMKFVGSVKVAGNVPCVRCGDTGQCSVSGLKMIFGHAATPSEVGINSLEESPATIAALERLGSEVGAAVYG